MSISYSIKNPTQRSSREMLQGIEKDLKLQRFVYSITYWIDNMRNVYKLFNVLFKYNSFFHVRYFK